MWGFFILILILVRAPRPRLSRDRAVHLSLLAHPTKYLNTFLSPVKNMSWLFPSEPPGSLQFVSLFEAFGVRSEIGSFICLIFHRSMRNYGKVPGSKLKNLYTTYAVFGREFYESLLNFRIIQLNNSPVHANMLR